MTKRKQRIVAVALVAGTVSALVGLGCGGGSSTTAAVPIPKTFTIVDGPVGVPTTLRGINNGGTVVGFTVSNGGIYNYVRSAGGTFTSLDVGDQTGGMANGINDAGTVVGQANSVAIEFVNGGVKVLNPFNSTTSTALGINNSNIVVGDYLGADSTPGFVDAAGTFTSVNAAGASAVGSLTSVQGINNSGLAIGSYSTSGGQQHGFTYNTASGKVTLLPDPSTSHTATGGLALTQFLGINDRSEAVGYYQTTNGSQYGFLYNLSANTYTFLDEPNAASINGVLIEQFTGVNNSGEICGFYIGSTGLQHGFIATP